MKTISITVGGQRYTANKVTVRQAKDAMQLNMDALDLLLKAREAGQDPEKAQETLQETMEQLDRKIALIAEVFGVPVDQVEKGMSMDEVNSAANRIVSGVGDVIEKN
jgi:hypothetical protein